MGDKFNTECLNKHNEFRRKHGCPALTHSGELARAAQKWADQLASQGRLQHSPESSGKIGENVAMKWVEGGTEFTGQQVTCQWYSEIKDFQFGKENQTNCGHFSQVVWKGSQEAGFGRAEDKKSGKVFAVGQYRPPGNFMNKWNENIPRPVNGRIEVPSEEDIMGPQTCRAAPKQSNNSHLKADVGAKSSDDVLVSKQTKTKTSGGAKITTVTETYQKPDGSKYTLTKETKEGASKIAQKIEDLNLNKTNGHNESEPPIPMLGTDTGDFRRDVLDAHNAYRRLHGCLDLRSNRELDQTAQQWADHLAATNSFKHSTSTHNGAKLGENIACKWGSGVRQCRGREVVHQWYSEEPKFAYGENPRQMDAGHFSQVVWMESEELGVGSAVSSSGKHITVCNYYPAGNMMGKFPLNVRPPRAY